MRTGRRPIGRGQRSTATRSRTDHPGRRLLHRELLHVVHCTASRLRPRPNPRLKTCEISSIRFPHHKIMRSWPGTETRVRARQRGSGAHQPPLLGAVCRCVRPCRARASPHHMGHALVEASPYQKRRRRRRRQRPSWTYMGLGHGRGTQQRFLCFPPPDMMTADEPTDSYDGHMQVQVQVGDGFCPGGRRSSLSLLARDSNLRFHV